MRAAAPHPTFLAPLETSTSPQGGGGFELNPHLPLVGRSILLSGIAAKKDRVGGGPRHA
jgi:hypothetical protein